MRTSKKNAYSSNTGEEQAINSKSGPFCSQLFPAYAIFYQPARLEETRELDDTKDSGIKGFALQSQSTRRALSPRGKGDRPSSHRV